ncbi:hypothetical protein BD410DRAFT_647601 [Rickenella mellea]|uniref:F-box domain-containing protein n=1 Tax=Rickenella mellea TaxID=50990 RepID=A0A4Y7PLK1_9AGAM|nr:hypothetical protein BD410DRAFT_647601 [Rickenella mellea]
MVETLKQATAPKGVHGQVSASDLRTRASRDNQKAAQSDHSLSATRATPLDKLINFLTRVRADGVRETFALDIWDERSDVSFAKDVHPPYPLDLLAFRRALSEAKACMAALQDIKYRLTRRIRTLKNRCALVLSDGLNRLPDEILANVFGIGHISSDDHKFSLTVSHVCHRFRAVALNTPLLWTRICTHFVPRLTKAFISRAGQMHLDVTFSWQKKLQSKRMDKNLEILRPNSHRWRSLRLHSVPSISQVQSLRHQLSQPRYLDCFDETYPDHLAIFTNSVQSFKAFHIPPRSHRLRITTCALTFDTSVEVRTAVAALYEMKNLRDLAITFDGCRSDGGEENFRYLDGGDGEDFPLDTFSLTVKEFTDLPVVRQLLDTLYFYPIAKLPFRWTCFGTAKNQPISSFMMAAGILFSVLRS